MLIMTNKTKKVLFNFFNFLLFLIIYFFDIFIIKFYLNVILKKKLISFSYFKGYLYLIAPCKRLLEKKNNLL